MSCSRTFPHSLFAVSRLISVRAGGHGSTTRAPRDLYRTALKVRSVLCFCPSKVDPSKADANRVNEQEQQDMCLIQYELIKYYRKQARTFGATATVRFLVRKNLRFRFCFLPFVPAQFNLFLVHSSIWFTLFAI